MRHDTETLANELLQVQQELDREQEGARRLRRALELAAIYFQFPGEDAKAEVVWMEIVRAIRSDAGRAEDREPVELWEREDAPSTKPATKNVIATQIRQR